MSPLLKRLHGDLAAATDNNRRAELQALIACHLARQGRFEDARNAIANARSLFPESQADLGILWIMLAEGLMQFFEHQSLLALDRIARSQALAMALKYSTLVAVSSAWKAHIEFENSRFESMITSLELSRQHADEKNHDAQTRMAMVLFNCFTMWTGAGGATMVFEGP